VIALLGGLGAAACWATATLCTSRSARMIGAPSVLAWVMLVGLVLVGPLVAKEGVPSELGAPELAWLVVAGVAVVSGLLLIYGALRVGQVSIVAPITSTEGAIAAVLAIVTGEAVGVGTGLMLVVIAAGVAVASFVPGGTSGDQRRASLLAVAAALCFGVVLYSTGQLSDKLPLVWAIIPGRIIGVAAVAIPLAVTGRLQLTRAALPLVATAGVCEIAGFASYAAGSRDSVAIAAVLASQFAALTVLGAYVLFRERITRLQLGGVVAIAVGVAALTALQA
jgi:drug/metabolite transporter (DMT)-like permease